jgi:hypothetical protein
VDLIEHTFLVAPPPVRDGNKPVLATQRQETYCPLSQSLSTPYGKFLKPRQARKVLPLLPLSHGTAPIDISNVLSFARLVGYC